MHITHGPDVDGQGQPDTAGPDNSTTPEPTPADSVDTPYGSLGKWMLAEDGQIANWIGQTIGGRKLYEPINLVIVDLTATSPGQATERLRSAMAAAAFPDRWRHSDGYRGMISGVTYQQQPDNRENVAFSDANTLLPNNHGRAFGPAALAGGGYVWTAQFSREKLGFHQLKPTHVYVSFQRARTAVADQLVSSQAGTLLGTVDLANACDEPAITTGDADGHATVIELAVTIPEARADLLAGEPSDAELAHWWATATSPDDPLPGNLRPVAE